MKTTVLSNAVAIIATVVMASAAPASADDRAQAEAHFRSAEAHFQSGNYRAAIRGYQDSYELFPAPLLLFNIGLCHQKLGEKQKALDKYREYLKKEPGGPKSAEARTRAEALEELIATEKAAAAQKRRAQIAELRAQIVTLRADGKHSELARALGELNALEPDPELVFDRAAAHEQAGETDAAIEQYGAYLSTENPSRGDEARERLEALRKKGDGNDGNDGGGNGNNVVGPGPGPGAARPDGGPSLVLPMVTTGATVVTLSLGALFGFSVTTTRDELEGEIDEADPPLDSNDPRFGDIDRNSKIANVLFLATAVGAGVSAYLWYRYVSAKRTPTGSLTVAPQRGGANVGVQVRF